MLDPLSDTFVETAGLSRREVVRIGGLGAAGLMAGGSAASAAAPPRLPDIGQVEGNRVVFPPWTADTEAPAGPPPAPLPPGEPVGFAIVGLGKLSLEEILPAFGQSLRAKPVALVSGTPDKAALVARQYGIRPEAVYDYGSFDRIAENPEIQAVYIVLPNGLHRDYVVRAARAGKHVLCEKPMANTSAEGRDMIAACKAVNVKLMIAYRCQYEPYNREVICLARSGRFGPIRLIEGTNTQNMGTREQWRFDKALAGGGALYDIGLYCLNTARAITGEEPVSIQAQTFSPPGDDRYAQLDETVTFTLRFPGGAVATASSSYGMHTDRALKVHFPAGTLDLRHAFDYRGQELTVGHRAGEVETSERLMVASRNQFGLELDHMATCIATDRTPRTPGEEGLQDLILMEAIYAAAKQGGILSLPAASGRDATRGPQPEKA